MAENSALRTRKVHTPEKIRGFGMSFGGYSNTAFPLRQERIPKIPGKMHAFPAGFPFAVRKFRKRKVLAFLISMMYNTREAQKHLCLFPGVAQLVARLLWEQDAAGSNPVTRTSFLRKTA